MKIESKDVKVGKIYLCVNEYEVIVEKVCETQNRSPSGYIFVKGIDDGITECVHHNELEEINDTYKRIK